MGGKRFKKCSKSQRTPYSKKGIELAKKIINILLEDEGCAESFPYDIVDRLKTEFGVH